MKKNISLTFSPILAVGLVVVIAAGAYMAYQNQDKSTNTLGISSTPTPTPPIGAIITTPSAKPTSTPDTRKEVEAASGFRTFYTLNTSLSKKGLLNLPINSETYLMPSATLSKDGSLLAYADNGNINIKDTRTGKITTLVESVPYSEEKQNFSELLSGIEAFISPDGKYVAYRWSGWEISGFGIIASDGTNNARLETCYSGGSIAWSSDSKKFALSSTRNDFGGENACLYIADVSTPKEGKQILVKNDTSYGFDVYKDPYNVQWSPDNTKLAFGYRYLDYTNDSGWERAEKYRGIYTVNADGTDFKQISDNRSFSTHPIWLDNNTLVYGLSNKDFGTKKGIFKISVNGENNTELTSNSDVIYEPISVSSDGSLIIFRSYNIESSGTLLEDKLKQRTVYALNTKTSAVTKLGTEESFGFLGWQ